MKISTKLTLLFSATLIVVGLLPSYFYYTSCTHQLKKTITEKLDGMAADTMNTADQMFYERYLDINMLAADPIISSADSTAKKITGRLREYKNGHPLYLSFSFFDLNRVRIADTAGINIGVRHSLTEYWPEISAGKEFVTNLSQSESLGIAVLHFAAIVKDGKGKAVGVVVSRLALESFGGILKDHVKEYNMAKGVLIELLDSNGLVIYSEQKKTDMFKNVSHEWGRIKQYLDKGINSGSFSNDDEDEFMVFAKESGYSDHQGSGWVMLIEMPGQLAFASLRELRDMSRLILGIMTILAFPAVFLFARSLVKPLHALRDASAEIGTGNLEARVSIQSNDEIGELAASFNRMGAKLRKANHDRDRAETGLKQNLEQQRILNQKLEEAQSHLLQSEKMASLGQLAAGVAHELNNPIGFVYSNMGTLKNYLNDIFAINAAYEKTENALAGGSHELDHVHRLKQEKDYDYIKQDIFQLMDQSKDGLERMGKIVQDLKDFSHVGDEGWKWVDLHKGIDSTLNIAWHELKYKCQVNKEYGTLPEVFCIASQINQVFLNLLSNAGQAIDTKGDITVRTGVEGDGVWVEVADTGKGISPKNINRIFEPFFTTKPVGVGTGLGLSLSYGIMQKHHGRIEVQSEEGKGTTMRIWLPVKPALA